MTNRSGQPSAKAHIDDLQAWATGKTNSAATSAVSKPSKVSTRDASVFASEAAPIVVRDSAGSAQVGRRRAMANYFAGKRSADDYGDAGAAEAKPPMSLAIKVLIGLGLAVGAYLVFSVLIGIVMMALMAAGAVAAVYAAYRIGRWQGRRDAPGSY